MLYSTSVLFLTFLLVLSYPAMAQDGREVSAVPVPQTKAQALGGLHSHLEQQKAERELLADEISRAKSDVLQARRQLVVLGQDIQRTESEMLALEARVAGLGAEKTKLEDALHKDQRKSARLALALQRITQIPPEALLARPSSPIRTVQGGILIQSSIPLIQKEAQQLRQTLERLQIVSEELAEDRRGLLSARQKLSLKQAQMERYLAERRSYQRKTAKEHEALGRHIAEISAQAKSLGDLVRRLEQNKNLRPRKTPAFKQAVLRHLEQAKPIRPDKKNKRSDSDNGQAQDNEPRLPVSGIIQVGYGDKDVFGARSRGLKIRTREESLVIAPYGGAVQFAGEFGRFGKVVIIEHDDGYHSLVSGLGRLDISVGDDVLTGEPLGIMGYSIAGDKPVLYYELRRNGNPVNPSVKLPELVQG